MNAAPSGLRNRKYSVVNSSAFAALRHARVVANLQFVARPHWAIAPIGLLCWRVVRTIWTQTVKQPFLR